MFAFHSISGCDVGHCISACPHGWEENGDSCFFWSSAENSWDDAEAWCKRQDSHLASVPSPSIREYILNSMKRKNIEKLWLGGNDKDYEGIWSWADCSFFGFTSWASGEPNNAGTEHCMEMVKDWTGVSCGNHHAPTCADCPQVQLVKRVPSIFHLLKI